MNAREAITKNLTITKAEALNLCGNNISTKEVYINNTNDCGHRYIDIFCIAEDQNTKEEYKMKIRIEGQQNITFSYLTDEEYNKIVYSL